MQNVLSLGLVSLNMGSVSHAIGLQRTPAGMNNWIAYSAYMAKVVH